MKTKRVRIAVAIDGDAWAARGWSDIHGKPASDLAVSRARESVGCENARIVWVEANLPLEPTLEGQVKP